MKGLMILCKKEVYSCSYVQHTRTMWREGVPQRTLIKSVLCGECVYGKIICAWHNPSLNGKSVDFAQTKTYYVPFLQAFHAEFNHMIFKMIPCPNLEGSQS